MRRAVMVLLVLFLGSILGLKAASPPPAVTLHAQEQDQNAPPNPEQSGAFEPFSAEQLDNLVSPIALYPDPLLAQVLVAATFPDQVEEAARWVRGNGQAGIDDQNWDVSVRAVAHYPTPLHRVGHQRITRDHIPITE
jgi:hypothetical protein